MIVAEKRAKVQKELQDIDDCYKKEVDQEMMDAESEADNGEKERGYEQGDAYMMMVYEEVLNMNICSRISRAFSLSLRNPELVPKPRSSFRELSGAECGLEKFSS